MIISLHFAPTSPPGRDRIPLLVHEQIHTDRPGFAAIVLAGVGHVLSVRRHGPGVPGHLVQTFTHVWGSSSLAFAAVGGSFLFGLGVGAYASGRLADRLVRPLRWYGICELVIGLAALTVPFQIEALVGISSAIYAHLPQEPVVRFLLQFLVTLLIIGPPSR